LLAGLKQFGGLAGFGRSAATVPLPATKQKLAALWGGQFLCAGDLRFVANEVMVPLPATNEAKRLK